MLKNESPKVKEIKELREKELTQEAVDVRKINLAAKSKKKVFKGVKNKEEKDVDQKIIDLARVTRVMAGGKRMSFRAAVIVGDKAGKVGFGMAKGADVSMAVNKAVLKAKKAMIVVRMVNETIPYQVDAKFKSAKVLIKPASKGTGIISGGAVRSVLEIAGVPNVVSKILGSPSKVNNVRCTLRALEKLSLIKKKSKNNDKGEKIEKVK